MILLTKNGLTKKVVTGFSWKALLFGWLYPICIGDFKGAFRHFCYASVTFELSIFFVPFFYNSKKLKTLIEDGYTPKDYKAIEYLTRKFDYQS